MKRLGLAILLVLSFSTRLWAESLPGANVESLLSIAREHSPDLRMARQEEEAFQARVLPAGALPDPVLRIELENITRNGTQAATINPAEVGDTKYSVLQPLPFWGKRDLKREIATSEADQASGRTSVMWTEIATRIKSLFAQYWVASKSLQLTRENIELTRRLEKIAQARYAGGLAAQQDAIRAQVEHSTLDAELVGLESEHHHLSAFINAMLSRSANASLSKPVVLRPIPLALDPDDLNKRLLARNPQVLIESARLGGATKARDLAYRNRYPDFTLGVVPTQVQNRVDAWSLMLEMNIPLQQSSRRAQEFESERMLEAAASRKEGLQHRLSSELVAALSELESSRSTEQITRDRLLPQAELTFTSALAAYETGKVDFATLLDALRQIRNAKLSILRTQANQQMRLADIERLLGEDL